MPPKAEKSLILIADDEPDFAESLRLFLQSAGHECRLAADGDSALRLLQNEAFDAVLMDYRMPGNQNLECLQYVSRHYPEIPILMVTGYPSLPSAVESLKLRVFDYVTKPFDPPYLRRRVAEAVEWKRLRTALRESETHFRQLFEGIADAVLVHDAEGHLLDVNEAACLLLGYGRTELIRRNVAALMDDPSESAFRRFLTPRPDGTAAPFEVLLRARDGQTIPCEVIQRTAVREGKAVIQSVARDITARRKAEENLRWRNRQLAAYYAIARTVSGSLDLEQIFLRSLDETLQVMDSTLGALFVFEDDGHLRTTAQRQMTEEFIRAMERDVAGSHPFRAIAEKGRVQAIEDFSGASAAFSEAIRQQRLSSLVLVPIQARGETLGLLLIAYDRPVHFAERETEMLEVIGTEIAGALENGRLYSAVIDSERRYRHLSGQLIQSLEDERARIARELHDSLGQILTSIGIDVDRQVARLPSGATPLAEVFDRLRRQLGEAQTTVRQLTASLRPGILDDLGLVAALESYLDEFQERTGIACLLENQAGPVLPISSDCSVALYRVAQEALTNTARHAQAKSVRATISREDDSRLVLLLKDDGRGFDPSALNWQASFGLLGMRERLQLVGGNLYIQSQPGAGVAIRAAVPLRKDP